MNFQGTVDAADGSFVTIVTGAEFCRRLKEGDRVLVIYHDDVPVEDEQSMHETVLSEAERIINGPRRDAYGDAVASFDAIAAGWSVILGASVNGTQVALCMDWLKTCRFLSANDRDSLVDKGGYTGLAARLSHTDP